VVPANRTIQDLRELLFDTIQGVKNGTIDTDKAKVIGDLSQVMVNTAKVEVDFIKATDGVDSGFLTQASPRHSRLGSRGFASTGWVANAECRYRPPHRAPL
jgi:hypothetical protein